MALEVDWNREVFLSENGQFLSPTNLYYCDDDELKVCFASKVEISWLPFHWDNVKGMLSSGGFKRLSQCISVTKKFDSLKEIDGDQISQLLQRLSYVKNYLSKKKYELFTEFQKVGVLKRGDEMGKKTILAVDDEPEMLSLLEKRLVAAGYEVLTAANGKEAIEVAKREVPALIILDILMPGMDGSETAAILL